MYGAGGQKRVPDDFVRNFRIALPCTQEQSAIAAFLDRETAKIDALVAEQEKLIELLKEKRQAVISHAVTKGLDPNVPMKDSGVEWLGKVPEHWEVKKGIQMGSFFGSFVLGDDAITEEGEIPYIKVGSLPAEDFKISTFDWFVSALDVERYEGFSGYVVFPKRGAAIYGNKVAIVNVLSFIDPNLMGWKPHSNVDLRFLAYTLKARRIDELADVSTVPQINVKHIAPEKFPLPPIEEQIKIADYLETQNLMLGNMIAESQRAIDLLKERRSALISAAVTGKIDVRGLTDATQ
jgi:type I restriction enzyme S subunit